MDIFKGTPKRFTPLMPLQAITFLDGNFHNNNFTEGQLSK